MNDTRDWQSTGPLDPARWIACSALAAEGFGRPRYGADTLEARIANLCRDLADHIMLDDIGRAHIPRSIAREMFTDRAQRQADAKARDAAHRAELAARATSTVKGSGHWRPRRNSSANSSATPINPSPRGQRWST